MRLWLPLGGEGKLRELLFPISTPAQQAARQPLLPEPKREGCSWNIQRCSTSPLSELGASVPLCTYLTSEADHAPLKGAHWSRLPQPPWNHSASGFCHSGTTLPCTLLHGTSSQSQNQALSTQNPWSMMNVNCSPTSQFQSKYMFLLV